jgi:iron complex outermembrane receptor protein
LQARIVDIANESPRFRSSSATASVSHAAGFSGPLRSLGNLLQRPAALFFIAVWLVAASAQAGENSATQRVDSIVVTGVYEPVPLEESDRSVSVLEPSDRLLLSNVTDLLRLEPSVDLRQRTAGGAQGDISIRGGTFGQTLVLLDGLRLNDAQTGHHNMDLPLPVEAVARVEVLKGSGSTLYGSDAVGGVVNIVTRPPEASEFRVLAGAGSFGYNQQRMSAALVRGRLSQSWTAAREFSTGFMPNRDYRSLTLASLSTLKTAPGTTAVTLGYADRPFGAQDFYGDYPSWERTRTWFASARQELGARTQAAFAYRRHTDLFVLYRDRPQVYANRHSVESVQVSLRRHEEPGRSTRIHYGLEGLGDSITSSNLGAHSRASGAAYGALDTRAWGRLSFSAGLREQLYGRGRSALSPSLGAGLWLSPRWRIRASASRAFRLPSYTDLYYSDPATQGSPELQPESAWSFEAGLNWYPAERWRGEAVIFHRRETGGIDYVRNSATEVWKAANIQRMRFTGMELSLYARPWRAHELDLRYTGLRGVSESLQGMLSRYVFNYPTNSLSAGWQGALPGRWLVRARLGVTKRLGRDAYLKSDLYFARAGRRLRPFFQISNVSDAAYEEIAKVPMPGRSVAGGVEYIFRD